MAATGRPADVEIFLTLSPRQRADFAKNLAKLRKTTGAASNTAAILDAVRAQADNTPAPKGKATAT